MPSHEDSVASRISRAPTYENSWTAGLGRRLATSISHFRQIGPKVLE
jgi:hypothetical protein